MRKKIRKMMSSGTRRMLKMTSCTFILLCCSEKILYSLDSAQCCGIHRTANGVGVGVQWENG